MDRRNFIATGTAVAATALSMPLFSDSAKANPPLRGKFASDSFEYLDSPSEAPNLVFQDEYGRDVSVSDYRGKVIVATIWATWCGVCKHEMPTINKAAKRYPSSQVVFMPISIDGNRSKIQRYYDTHGLSSLKVFHDPDRMSLAYFGARGTPTSFLIDQQGNFRGRIEGPAGWDSADARAIIDYLVRRA